MTSIAQATATFTGTLPDDLIRHIANPQFGLSLQSPKGGGLAAHDLNGSGISRPPAHHHHTRRSTEKYFGR
ncbi:MAG: hypothetical protein II336_18975 [Loktanella sp.]|nr:hypothetical protein [Loktanella sp.]